MSPLDDAPIFTVSTKRYLTIGIIASVVMVFGLGGWAALTPISGAVVAQGWVVVSSRVKDVQHREGGIVEAIFVDDGDRVKKGDLLVELDDTQTRAGRDLVAGQLLALRARLDRLSAERDGRTTLAFRPDIESRRGEPLVDELLEIQSGVFAARRATLEGQTAQLNEQIAQLEEQIGGLTAQRDAKATEIELVNAELEDLRQLLRRDLVPRSRVTAREREAVRLDGEEGELTARIATARGRIAEIRMQILQITTEFQQTVLDEIAGVQTEIVTLSERNVAADDQLARVDLRAPEDGVVHELAVTTVGGVVAPGATLMKIVPDSDNLIVEARIAPINVDDIVPGQEAGVMLTGLSIRDAPRLQGTVGTVSADRTTDPNTGMDYFTVRITLSQEERDRLGDQELLPGMPADVFIRTNDRTVLAYLIKPLMDAANLAFTEG